jgi:hypothetical protein
MTDADALTLRYPILRFFTYDHLPPALAAVSAPLCELAWQMARSLPYDEETASGLRHLMRAKDCLVRAAVNDD